ncbi:hypothetical protein Plhal304r1_c012g0045211 [Plasmopara halstedii]
MRRSDTSTTSEVVWHQKLIHLDAFCVGWALVPVTLEDTTINIMRGALDHAVSQAALHRDGRIASK